MNKCVSNDLLTYWYTIMTALTPHADERVPSILFRSGSDCEDDSAEGTGPQLSNAEH